MKRPVLYGWSFKDCLLSVLSTVLLVIVGIMLAGVVDKVFEATKEVSYKTTKPIPSE